MPSDRLGIFKPNGQSIRLKNCEKTQRSVDIRHLALFYYDRKSRFRKMKNRSAHIPGGSTEHHLARLWLCATKDKNTPALVKTVTLRAGSIRHLTSIAWQECYWWFPSSAVLDYRFSSEKGDLRSMHSYKVVQIFTPSRK